MRWRNNRRSSNIEDNRGRSAPMRGRSGGGGGLLRLLPTIYNVLGFKGTAVVVLGFLGFNLFTGNISNIIGDSSNSQNISSSSSSKPIQETAEERELVDFISTILADTEDTWQEIFHQNGMTYKAPKLVLFRNAVSSACGLAQSATGPFYCPGDQKVYIDLSFYSQLKNRFKAPGDFAQAYVLAHEIGHHVQTLTGISSKVHKARSRLKQTESNKLSVLQELQADCFAGIWAHKAQAHHMLEAGDLEEGITAASAIGDDTLQKQATGRVRPDAFTHGSSKQRVKWFKKGFSSGDLNTCDTFNTRNFQAQPRSGLVSSYAKQENLGADKILAAFKHHKSNLQVHGIGTVSRTLRDDTKGSRHQKFILRLNNGHQILVAHNIDLSSKILSLAKDDRVEFFGEYEWTPQGGVLHWTHKDPHQRHQNGWLKHNGKTYQ